MGKARKKRDRKTFPVTEGASSYTKKINVEESSNDESKEELLQRIIRQLQDGETKCHNPCLHPNSPLPSLQPPPSRKSAVFRVSPSSYRPWMRPRRPAPPLGPSSTCLPCSSTSSCGWSAHSWRRQGKGIHLFHRLL